MTSIIDTLTLSDATKKQALPAHVQLRMKLLAAIELQQQGAAAELSGKTFTKKVDRWVEDPNTGERTKAQADGRFRKWWWVGENGRVLLEVRYANKPLEIKPNKRVIDIGTAEQIIPTLEKIAAAIKSGELDKALNNALALRRKELKGSKAKSA
jgi:hypothetical protein